MTSGVPQGSVLGPLLFLIYVNDLPIKIESECRLFADDAILYNTSSNLTTLSNDLTSLEAWSKRWQMSFNTSKCAFLQIGKKIANHPGYSFCGGRLTQVDCHPYLGVQLQSNLKWDQHINSITTKATQRLAMLKRVLRDSNLPTRKVAYFSIVRPVLEYACQVWDPYQKNQVKQLEKVQNQALRFLFGIRGQVSFSELRKETDIKSLNERRKDARFSLFLRCLEHGIEPVFPYNLEKGHNTRQRSDTYTPHIRTNLFYYSFWPRTMRELRA